MGNEGAPSLWRMRSCGQAGMLSKDMITKQKSQTIGSYTSSLLLAFTRLSKLFKTYKIKKL